MSDSIKIKSNITFDNLAPLSTYLGKPGRADKGALSIEEYRRRRHNITAPRSKPYLDTPYFIERARHIYGYDHLSVTAVDQFARLWTQQIPMIPFYPAFHNLH